MPGKPTIAAAALMLNIGSAQAFFNLLQPDPQAVAPTSANLYEAAPVPRELVRFDLDYAPGTVVVSTSQRRLYLVLPGHQAIRYGVGVGKQGFSWRGSATVGRKGVWPDWSPTATMVSLNRNLPRHMKSGLDNPLGARALYLYQGNRDILFRIHGTNEPWSIGEQVSSGCIRMLNEDIVDLYNRVPTGTTVLVRRGGRWRV